jgi:glutathione-regulated potassium-efflux system protein KefB
VWQSIALGAATMAGAVAAGRWLLDPFFALLARVGAREVILVPARSPAC